MYHIHVRPREGALMLKTSELNASTLLLVSFFVAACFLPETIREHSLFAYLRLMLELREENLLK